MRHANRRAGGAAGFTLVEILVVMALISVLMGFGIGMYQSLSTLGKATQARNTVLETIRQVKNSSQTWPAALVLDSEQGVVYGLQFQTVASCNFEPEADADPAAGPATQVIGLAYKHGRLVGDARLEPYPFGHTGGGLVLTTGGSVNFGNFADYDLVEGVEISVWVYPTENQSMTLVRKGDSYGLRLVRGSTGPVAEGFLCLAEEANELGGATKGSKERYTAADHPLLLNRWNRVVFNYDRTAVTVAVDSFDRGAVLRLFQKEERRMVPDADADLVMGEPDLLVGRVDDLRVAGVLSSDPRALPEEVTLLPRGAGDNVEKVWKVRFLDGKLDPEYHRAIETIRLVYQGVENPIQIGTLGNIMVK